MKLIFELRHPAHYHHFKSLIKELLEKGNQVKVNVSKKDILLDLLKESSIEYEIIGENKPGLFNKAKEIYSQTKKAYKIYKDFKPDLIIGRPSITVTLGASLASIDNIIFAEDDLRIVLVNGLTSMPFAGKIISPSVTDLGVFNYKKIGYKGYQKLAYLHPNSFVPDKSKIKEYVDFDKPVFLLRFAKLSATHDKNIKGMSIDVAERLVDYLKEKGNVYISSEKKLSSNLDKYINPVPVKLIHHLLFYSDLFIADSQSMSMEAAMLGTPSIRFSDFAGRISVLEELEKKYELTFGVKPSEPYKLFDKVDEILNTNNYRNVFQKRREKMLNDKINVFKFMLWFVENYPESKKILKENPDYQNNFK